MWHCVDPVAQSVWRLATGWTIWDRIPVGTRFSACPDRPWGPPSLLYNGYRVFPRRKVRPGRAADSSPPSSAAVMEKYSYNSTYPLGHTGPVRRKLYLYLYTHTHIYVCVCVCVCVTVLLNVTAKQSDILYHTVWQPEWLSRYKTRLQPD